MMDFQESDARKLSRVWLRHPLPSLRAYRQLVTCSIYYRAGPAENNDHLRKLLRLSPETLIRDSILDGTAKSIFSILQSGQIIPSGPSCLQADLVLLFNCALADFCRLTAFLPPDFLASLWQHCQLSSRAEQSPRSC